MNDNKWTREKFLEYRKLKRSGYTHGMLKDHFGEDIYNSGLYNKNAHVLPRAIFDKLNEIKINPEETRYDITPVPSNISISNMDYLLTFVSGDISYTICLMYFCINTIDTHNIVFTTTEQWNRYRQEFFNISKKGNVTKDEHILLNDIISKETNLNDIFPIFRKISWVLMDFYESHIKGGILSIGDTENKKKIKIYRNIIKDSFININESKEIFNDEIYYIYKIDI